MCVSPDIATKKGEHETENSMLKIYGDLKKFIL